MAVVAADDGHRLAQVTASLAHPERYVGGHLLCSAHASEIFEDEEDGWLISNVNKAVGYSHLMRDKQVPSKDLSLARLVFRGDEPELQRWHA